MKKFLSFLLIVLFLAACASRPSKPSLILATTTSTQDSGLLDVLIPLFEQQSGYRVQVVAVGSGAAMKMGEEGNADVLLVHSPAAEEAFMQAGWGKDRALVMHNDFVLVGPLDDPARVKGLKVTEALQAIVAGGALFISRGDQSGTHAKELALWKAAGIDSKSLPATQYLESGQGMGMTLTLAGEKQAYTLTDRATFLVLQKNLNLAILVEGDQPLLNIYHVITVNPQKWPKVNYQGALAFLRFLTDAETQELIAGFGVDRFGQPLFFPDAGKAGPGMP